MLFKALLLDLDGTVRHGGDPCPNKPEDVKIYSDVMEKLRYFKAKDYKILGVSNQACVGLGMMSKEMARLIMHKTNELMGYIFDEIVYCPHRPDEGCACRKPQPGMIFYLAVKHDLDLPKCLMVGDLDSDKGAAFAAGVPFEAADKFFGRKKEWKR